MQWLLVLSTLTAVYVLSGVWTLIKHFLTARQSGLPAYISPTNPANPLWMISQVFVRPVLEKLLPAAAFERINITIHGWEFRGRYTTHAKYGTTFMYATPGTIELWVADEEIAHAILARRNDFVMPRIVGREYGLDRSRSVSHRVPGILNVFGPNLLSVRSITPVCRHPLTPSSTVERR